MPPDTPIYVIDDDHDMCRALTLVLTMDGRQTRSFTRPTDFLHELANLPPGLVISDVCMPEVDGLELVAKLAALARTDPVILITGHADVPLAVRALKRGACDFIEKPFEPATLLDAIVSAGVGDPQTGIHAHPLVARLSRRERQVFEQLVEGGTNKQIALKLGLSFRTVEVYRAKLMGKLECRNLSELVRLGLATRVRSPHALNGSAAGASV